jgi:hypothetical protein
MPSLPLEPTTFFAAAFIVVGLANGIMRAVAAGNHVKKSVETLKRVQAEGKHSEEMMQELKKTALAEMKRQNEIAYRHPAVMILSAVQSLILLGFIGFFFHEWMWYVARDVMETDVGRLWYNAQLGVLAFTGGFVLFRLVASLSSLNTTTVGPAASPEGNWLHVVADRRSAWHKLQNILLFLCFATVFSSLGYAVMRILIASSSTS